MEKRKLLALITALVLLVPPPAWGARIKDVTSVAGMRENPLIGYGLMVGLKNSGDRSYNTPFTIQTLLSMLKRLGTTVDIRQITGMNIGVSDIRQLRDIRVENVAAVMVTATLPPFARPGQILDVQVSSLGDARSLEGGNLLLTPLKGANGEVYAVAQGILPVNRNPRSYRRKTTSIPTVGVIQNAAIVEKLVTTNFATKSRFQLLLKRPDFTTANSIVTRVNATFGDGTAKGLDAGAVELKLPPDYKGDPFGFISRVEVLEVTIDSVAKVVLDEKTGTVVIGSNVEVNSVAISIGDMTVEVRSPFVQIEPSEKEKLNVLNRNADISDLVRALNALGVSPRDLVAIFRSLRAAGALNAELEIL